MKKCFTCIYRGVRASLLIYTFFALTPRYRVGLNNGHSFYISCQSLPCHQLWLPTFFFNFQLSVKMRTEGWMVVTMFIVSSLKTALANWDRVCSPFTKSFGPHPQGICGNRIDETLDLLCVGGYNEYPSYGGFRKKRDTSEGKTSSHFAPPLICPTLSNNYSGIYMS